MNWYQYTKTQLQTELKTDLERGLTQNEVKDRLVKFGRNILPEKKQDSWLVLFLRQFKSSLIYILLACAVIVFLIGDRTDGWIIVAVLVINAIIGTYQEGRSGQILQSIKKLSQVEVTVLRAGREVLVVEQDVVPGDVLVLVEGQRVAADARVVFGYNLSIDEAPLTGESGGVQKKDGSIGEENTPIASQHNMVFKGTSVLSGSGRAVVVGTGLNTEIGKISKALLEPEEEIPLQKNIRNLSTLIIYAVGIISALLLLMGYLLNYPFKQMFSVVVSLAVSIIPEGLPLVLTVILAHGVWRMSKKNALVKKMQAVEALGQAKVLAVDKTGTLTENQMVIKKVFCGRNIFRVTGNGYEPKGTVLIGEREQKKNNDILMSAQVASLASSARVYQEEETEIFKISGDPTEAALSVFGAKMGAPKESLLEKFRETSEIPFDYKAKFRAMFYDEGDKTFCAAAGALEAILPNCTHHLENGFKRQMHEAAKKEIEQAQEEFSAQGFRILAVAFKYQSKTDTRDNIKDLTFAALFAIEDALRPEAKRAVRRAEEAGLKVVMITGDHRVTARAIAKEAGIYKEGDVVITGPELLEMSEKDLAAKLNQVSVFARVTPEDKMKIIKAYKHAGLVIAMTGDGVNDAPSLVAADLGVGMGKIGTEVAKEAADIVLLDDNLGSIITAVREGRIMHQNIKKALQFLFSTSLGELFTIVLALILKMPLPVLAVQILWMNLITDPLIGAALALEKGEDEEDLRNNKFSKYFIDRPMLIHMLLVGVIMSVSAIMIFNNYRWFDVIKAQSVTLTLLSVFQWYNGLNCRFLHKSLFGKRLFTNMYVWLALGVNLALQLMALHLPFMQQILKTTPLSLAEWVTVLCVGLLVIFAEEIRKLFLRYR